MVCGLWFVGGV
jgi:hypothetical protein